MGVTCRTQQKLPAHFLGGFAGRRRVSWACLCRSRPRCGCWRRRSSIGTGAASTVANLFVLDWPRAISGSRALAGCRASMARAPWRVYCWRARGLTIRRWVSRLSPLSCWRRRSLGPITCQSRAPQASPGPHHIDWRALAAFGRGEHSGGNILSWAWRTDCSLAPFCEYPRPVFGASPVIAEAWKKNKREAGRAAHQGIATMLGRRGRLRRHTRSASYRYISRRSRRRNAARSWRAAASPCAAAFPYHEKARI